MDARDLVSLEETVLNTLGDTESSTLLVFHDTKGEGELAGLCRNLRESRSGGLHLEEVGGGSLLVDGDSRRVGLGLRESQR